MSLRRNGTPLTRAPPSLEASNQAQIEDLVQRNRTLEYKNTKLTEQVAQEAARTKEAVLEIQRQWEVNQQQWKEGCEDIITSYRIVQKQVEVELERERTAVIREMKFTRDEKLQRLKRDVKIKLFQMNEEALERKIEELEEERAYAVEEIEDALRQEREKLASHATKLKENKAALARSIKDKEDKEAKYNKLVAEYSTMEASSGNLDAKLQRAQLKYEGAQNKIDELERLNNDLKRANTDLNNQRERWENLETKGGEAKEMEHKKRVALELELNELKENYEAQEQDLAKAKKKLEKIKDVATNYEAEAKEQQQVAAEAHKKLAKLQKQVDKLKAELEEERARIRPLSPHVATEISTTPEMEASEDEGSPKKKAPTKKPASKAGPSTAKAKTSKLPPPSQTARKSTGGRLMKQPIAIAAEVDTNEPEVVELEEEDLEPPKKQRKGKGKGKAVNVDEVEVEEVPVAPKRRKRKASEEEEEEEKDEDDNEIQIVEKPKTGRKAAAAKKPAAKSRGTALPASKQTAEKPDVEEDASAGVKKKKRKIFPTSNVGPFAFDSLAQFDNTTLNIPSMLSPVRPDTLVPQRSNTLSFMGNSMKSSSRK